MPTAYDHLSPWMTALLDIGLTTIGLGLFALVLSLLPAMNINALINVIVARPVYLLYLLVKREREPECKHGE